jgi:hypothetical protein
LAGASPPADGQQKHTLPAPAHSHPASVTIRHGRNHPQAPRFLTMTSPVTLTTRSLKSPDFRRQEQAARILANSATCQFRSVQALALIR